LLYFGTLIRNLLFMKNVNVFFSHGNPSHQFPYNPQNSEHPFSFNLWHIYSSLISNGSAKSGFCCIFHLPSDSSHFNGWFVIQTLSISVNKSLTHSFSFLPTYLLSSFSGPLGSTFNKPQPHSFPPTLVLI